MTLKILVVGTHPIQYQVPYFRLLARQRECHLKVLYAHLPNPEQQGVGFGRAITWDVDLFDGYDWGLLEGVRVYDKALDERGALSAPGIYSQLRLEAPNVLLLPGWHSRVLLQAAAAANRLGLATLVRGDSNDLRRRGILKRWRHRLLFSRYDAFLAVGRSNRRLYEAAGVPAHRIFDAPHAVDNDRFAASAGALRSSRAELRQAFGVSPEGFCLLFAGKLGIEKRPLDLLEALEVVRARRPNVELLVVGSGALEEELLAYSAERRLPVRFAGFLNQMEIPQAYVVADALVLPSGCETWGLVVNEAMASGLAAIVSDRVGCREDLVVEGETGFSYRMGEIGELADRVERLASDPGRTAEMGKEASRRVFAKYSIQRTVEGTRAAMEFALSARGLR